MSTGPRGDSTGGTALTALPRPHEAGPSAAAMLARELNRVSEESAYWAPAVGAHLQRRGALPIPRSDGIDLFCQTLEDPAQHYSLLVFTALAGRVESASKLARSPCRYWRAVLASSGRDSKNRTAARIICHFVVSACSAAGPDDSPSERATSVTSNLMYGRGKGRLVSTGSRQVGRPAGIARVNGAT
jgi:hypothetical protein